MPNPSPLRRASELFLDITLDVTSISKATSASPASCAADRISVGLVLATSIRMEPFQHDQDTSKRQVRSRQSASTLRQYFNSTLSRPQPKSSPLPQTQWAEIPLPYRPLNWVDPQHQADSRLSDLPNDWHARSRISGSALSSDTGSKPLKSRRRPHGLRSLTQRSSAETGHQPFDVTLLYPQMSPYDDHFSSHSAPDELQPMPRSVSQPNTPSFLQQRFEQNEPQPMQLPRSPTYPPTGRRRMHSATGIGDAAFADAEEFRLFVEATSGLGPEQAFRHSRPHSSSSSSRRPSRNDNNSQTRPEPSVSPVGETPTTMRALEHLAQMPQASAQPQRRPLQTSVSGLDLWLQPPSAGPVSQTLQEEIDELPLDEEDELPDYASSQAQAHAAQRVEAARRAEELQRRWAAARRSS